MHNIMIDEKINLVIAGSIGIDTVETPLDKKESILGGSASYACAAASFYTKTGMIGIAGTDFPKDYKDIWHNMKINLDGLQIESGKTFRWSGKYASDMDYRETLSTELNVFEIFSPIMPKNYQDAPYLFLGNFHPKLQLDVLTLSNNPKFVLIDTMDLWIKTAQDELIKVIKKCNMLTLNESEAKIFTNEENLIKAAKKLIELGPNFILIKKGAHGSILYSKDSIFLLHAYPISNCCDPTGAGDSFAGGLMGMLSKLDKINIEAIREAMIYGTVTASFGIEEFSLDRFTYLKNDEIEKRVHDFKNMCFLTKG